MILLLLLITASLICSQWPIYEYLRPESCILSWNIFLLGVPTSLEISAEPQGCYAALSWESPSYNTCPITRYTIHYRQSNQAKNWQKWQKTSFIAPNITKYRLKLNCNSTYQIMVLAWNERGSSIKAAKLIAVTTKKGTGVDMCFINCGGLKTFLPQRINGFSKSVFLRFYLVS